MIRHLKALPVIALALLLALPVAAQDGLSDDQLAALDRVIAAVNASETYQSYVHHAIETTTQELTLNVGGALIDASETEVLERTTFFTHDADGNPNLRGEFTATVSSKSLGANAPIEYKLNGEVRVVAGVVYLRATRESDDEASLPPMPDGWVIIENIDDWPALDILQLDDLFDNQDSPDIFSENVPDVLALAVDVTMTSETPDDGPAQDTVHITLNNDALTAALTLLINEEGTPDAGTAAYYAGMDDSSGWDMAFTLTETGDIASFTTDTRLSWTEFDISALTSDLPPGTLLDQTGQLIGEFEISSINADLTPVEAPIID